MLRNAILNYNKVFLKLQIKIGYYKIRKLLCSGIDGNAITWDKMKQLWIYPSKLLKIFATRYDLSNKLQIFNENDLKNKTKKRYNFSIIRFQNAI